jgi:hypothetical protein
MIDYSNLMGVGGNAGRGNQSPSNAFNSMSNMFGGGGRSGTGSAPMNIMPQNAGQQPGMDLQGMLHLIGNAFGSGSNFQNYMGNSWAASPLGQMFGAQQRQAPRSARETYNSTQTGLY